MKGSIDSLCSSILRLYSTCQVRTTELPAAIAALMSFECPCLPAHTHPHSLADALEVVEAVIERVDKAVLASTVKFSMKIREDP